MPDDKNIEIILSPPDLVERLNGFEGKLDNEVMKALQGSLYEIQNSVPSYPPRPVGSSYRRTGSLGRTLHVGALGNVAERKKLGAGDYQAKFGTRLEYAPWVIGDPPGKSQAKHMRHWWTMKDVKKASEPGIQRLFDAMMAKLAKWIEGRS